MGVLTEIFRQLFNKPATNLFPVPHHPEETPGLGLSVKATLKAVAGGHPIQPPIPIPEGFRGMIEYDRETCIGCRQCLRVCPSDTIEFIAEEKKVFFVMARCTFCEMCVNICPKDSIRMNNGIFENLLATTDKFNPGMLIYDSGSFKADEPEVVEEVVEEAAEA